MSIYKNKADQRVIGNTEKAFRDDFPGNSLDHCWEAPVIAGAATAVVSGSNLTINLTTAAADSVILTGTQPFSVPCRATFSLLLSARSANQEVILELISRTYKESGGANGHYARWKFDGTTATTAKTRTRNTDTEGTEASRTISTTAATVRLYAIDLGYDDVRFSQFDVDSTAARGAAFVHTAKIPAPEEAYYLRITVRNTAASTALTATLDFVSVQDITEIMAEIAAGTGFSTDNCAMPVAVRSMPTTNVGGQAAHDAAISGNPVRVGARALTANYAAVGTGDVADLVATLVGALITKPYAIPEAEWSYAAAAGGIVNTTDVVAKAAAGAGLRNYLIAFQVRNANATATEFVIKDGSTVIWRGHLPASMTGSMEVELPIPLKSSANAALNVACITTGAQVYFNAQGYVAP